MNTTKQQMQMNKVYLATLMDNTDYLIKNLHQSLTQLTLSHSIFNVALLSVAPTTNNDIGLAVTDLSQATSSNLLIKSSILYIRKLNFIITSSYKSDSLSYSPYRDLIAFYYAGKSQFKPISADTKTSYLFFYRGDFILARDFPLNDQKRLATIFYFINTHELYRHLTSKLPSASNLWIYDSDGNPLFTDEADYTEDTPFLNKIVQIKESNADYLIYNQKALFRSASDLTGWEFFYSVDESSLRPTPGSVLAFLLPLMLALMGVSLIISLLLAYYLYEPFRQLLISIENRNLAPEALRSSKDEVEYLNYAFSQIAGHQSELEAMMTEMQNIMKNVSRDVMSRFFLDRISNSQVSSEKVDEILTKIQSPYRKNDFYLACVIKCTGNKPFTEGKRVAMITELRDVLPTFDERKNSLSHLLVLDGQTFALILSYDEKTPLVKMKKDVIELERILRSLITKKDFTMHFGAGNIYRSILDIGFSYKEALLTLSPESYDSLPVSSPAETSSDSELTTRAQQVLSLILKNDSPGALTLVNRIFCNIRDSSSSLKSQAESYTLFNKALMDEIIKLKYINIFKISSDIISNTQKISGEMLDNKALFSTARLVCEKIIEETTEVLKKQNHHLIVAAQEYIIRNSTDINLSLNMLSEVINVNPSYLSRLFISNLGVHFTDYLNDFRVENSKGFLEETNFSIKEVAQKSGFSSVQNYIRVFKRHEGITPGSFRNNYIIKNTISG